MLENWCWTPGPLKALSQHYSSLSDEYLAAWKESAKDEPQPPEKIPDELIDNIIKSKHVNDGLFTLRQLHFGTFDMTVHEPKTHEDIEKTDCSILFNKLRKDITAFDGPETLGDGLDWGHGEATFGHLVGKFNLFLSRTQVFPASDPLSLIDTDTIVQAATTRATTVTSIPKSTPWICSTACLPKTP